MRGRREGFSLFCCENLQWVTYRLFTVISVVLRRPRLTRERKMERAMTHVRTFICIRVRPTFLPQLQQHHLHVCQRRKVKEWEKPSSAWNESSKRSFRRNISRQMLALRRETKIRSTDGSSVPLIRHPRVQKRTTSALQRDFRSVRREKRQVNPAVTAYSPRCRLTQSIRSRR